MTEYKAQQFTVEPEPGDPTAELSFGKLNLFGQIAARMAVGNDNSTYWSFQIAEYPDPAKPPVFLERALIDASGNVNAAGTLKANGLAVGTDQLTVSNGNVGIGTAAPGEKLEVSGTVKATAFDGNLNGSQVTTGTIADARLPLSISRTFDVDARFDPSTGHDHDGVDSKKISALSTTYFDSLNGASLTDLNGSQITTGTVAAVRIDPAIVRTSALGVANGIATLDSNTLVVQNPANATATPTASKIPIADASGKLAAGWGGNANTVATLDANTRVVQSVNTVWDGTAGRSASPTPAANTIPVLDASAKFPGSITGDANSVNGYHASAAPDPNSLVVRDSNGELASDTIGFLKFGTELSSENLSNVTVTNNGTVVVSLLISAIYSLHSTP